MDIITLTLLALTVTYLTHVLLLEQKVSHFGPFADENRVVQWEEDPDKDIEGHVQPVTLFDWVRRPFGVYTITNNVWKVHPVRSERWTCPICLSFWISAAIVVLYFVTPWEVYQYFLLILSLSGAASIANVNLL